MEKNIYLHNLNEGVYKRIIEMYSCKRCDKIPHYTFNNPSVELSLKGWDRINDLIYCPNCIRIIKIEKINK